MILIGERLILRPIESEDLEFIRTLVNDPEMESTIIGWTWPISRKDQEQWFLNYKNSEKLVRYIIETKTGQTIGLTGLRNIDWKNGTVSGGGIRIIRSEQSKGYASEAYKLLLSYCFKELRLHRFNESAFSDNIASLKFLEKIGFVREGIERECFFRSSQYKSVVHLSILSEEFFSLEMSL